MRRKWRELQAEMNAREPGRAEEMAMRRQRILAEYDTYQKRLPDLRRALLLTQQEVSAQLEVSQAQVSRIENQTDMYLSTLAGYIRALGGELKLVAAFDGVEVPLSLPALLAEADTEAAKEVTSLQPELVTG